MIISISGKPGSGKSTVAKKLAKALGYKRYYIGDMRRQAARKKGITLAEFNQWSENNVQGDEEFDELVKKLGQTEDNIIVESRTAFYFIPHSLKIFLDVSEEEGARRIWKSLKDKSQTERNEAKDLKSLADVLQSIRNRILSDTRRYRKYYGLDVFDRQKYDLFLDATHLSPKEEYNQVHAYIKKRLKN